MANEATLVVELEPPVSFTCADGTAIEKGTLVKITDPNTVAATTADGDAFIGVTAEEKIASDGRTKIGVWLRGIFKVTDSGGGVTAGQMLKINGANLVATTDEAGAGDRAEHCGKALESAAASHTFLAYLGY